jgi:peptidyl-tRNA hydrolase
LSPFSAEQKPKIRDAIADACDAILTVAQADLETAMNQFN